MNHHSHNYNHHQSLYYHNNNHSNHLSPSYRRDSDAIDSDPTRPPDRPLHDSRIRKPLPGGKPFTTPGIDSLKRELQTNVTKISSMPHRGRYISAHTHLLSWQHDDIGPAVQELAGVTGKGGIGSESPASSESPPVRPTARYSSPAPPLPARGLPGPNFVTAPTHAQRGSPIQGQVHPATFRRGQPSLPQEPMPSVHPVPQPRVNLGGAQWGSYHPQQWPPPQGQHPRVPWELHGGSSMALFDSGQHGQVVVADTTRSRPTTRGRGRGNARGGARCARGEVAVTSADLQFGDPGSTVIVPVNTQIASRAADQKRKRNAGASRRFRERKKLKTEEAKEEFKNFQQAIRDLRGLAERLEAQRDYYRKEKHGLRVILQGDPALAELAADRSPSPELLFANMVPSPELPSVYWPASSTERPAQRRRKTRAAAPPEGTRSASSGALPHHVPLPQYRQHPIPPAPPSPVTLPPFCTQQFHDSKMVHPSRPTSAS
jgi:hypothetical protein